MNRLLIIIGFSLAFMACQHTNSKEELILAVLDTIDREDTIVVQNESEYYWWILRQHKYENFEELLNSSKGQNVNRNKLEKYDSILNSGNLDQTLLELLDTSDLSEYDLPSTIQLISRKETLTMPKFEISTFNYYLFSSPSISKSGEFGFIYIAQHCGMECGGGDIWIFKRINDSWELYLSIPLWMS